MTEGQRNPKRDLAPRTALNPQEHTIDQRPRNRIIQILTAAFYGSPPVFLVSYRRFLSRTADRYPGRVGRGSSIAEDVLFHSSEKSLISARTFAHVGLILW